MLKSLKPLITNFRCLVTIGCCALLTFSLQAQVKASQANDVTISSVVKVTFINPEDGLASSCTGVMISPNRAVTLASCFIAEETAKQSHKAKVCSTVSQSEVCITSSRILTHPGYLSANDTNGRNNLAYIDLQEPFGHSVTPALEVTPVDFANLLSQDLAKHKAYLVSYDGTGISDRSPIRRSTESIEAMEFNYIDGTIKLDTDKLLFGHHYQGAAILLEHQGNFQLLGLVSTSNPDNLVHYYPEVNPCDEDPVIVRYPEPIVRSLTEITSYPVAACGMQGFQASNAFAALSCSRLLRAINLQSNLDDQNPIAMRQRAGQIMNQASPNAGVRDIYQLLYSAAEQGDLLAKIDLAELLLEGNLLPRDEQTAKQLLLSGDQSISPYADWLLAQELLKAYNDRDFRSINPTLDSRLLEHLKSAAKAGYPKAQYYLARMHQFGVGIKASNRTAYYWFAMSAMQGYAMAQFQIGTMWVDGRGVRSYPEVGHYWIRQAAAGGYGQAQNYLATNKGQGQIEDALREYELEYSDT